MGEKASTTDRSMTGGDVWISHGIVHFSNTLLYRNEINY